MRRPLIAATLACALLAPGLARPCGVVTPSGEGRVRAIRALWALPATGNRTLDLQVSFDRGTNGGTVALVVPVPAGATIDPTQSSTGGEGREFNFDQIDRATEPVVEKGSAEGGGSGGAVLVEPPFGRDDEWLPITGRPATAETVTTLTGLENALDRASLFLPESTRTWATAWFQQGGAVAVRTETTNATGGATGVTRIDWVGDATLPVSVFAACSANPLEAITWINSGQPHGDSVWDVLPLSKVDREDLRRTPYETLLESLSIEGDAPRWIAEFSGDTNLVTEGDFELAQLLPHQQLTRLRSLVVPSLVSADPMPTPDPSMGEVGNRVDLRPSPLAHGTSLSPWVALVFLAQALWPLRRR